MRPETGEAETGTGLGSVWAVVGWMLCFALAGWGASAAAGATEAEGTTLWAKVPAVCLSLAVLLAFLYWSFGAVSQRPELPSLAEVVGAPAAAAEAAAALCQATETLLEKARRDFLLRGIGPDGSLLYVQGPRFWATLLVILGGSVLAGLTQRLLETRAAGAFGHLLPLLFLVFYLEWLYLYAVNNHRPIYTDPFDQHNLLITRPSRLFAPPRPEWNAAGTSDIASESSSEEEGAGGWTGETPPEEGMREAGEAAASAEQRLTGAEAARRAEADRRAAFQQRRQAHYAGERVILRNAHLAPAPAPHSPAPHSRTQSPRP